MREESYKKDFSNYDSTTFLVTPYYKIKSLVGDDAFWESAQLLFAFVGNSYSFFENDFKFCMQSYYDSGVEIGSSEKIYEDYLTRIQDLNEEANKYYKILMELQNLAAELETKPLSFKDLESFKDKPMVITMVKGLRSEIVDKKEEGSES